MDFDSFGEPTEALDLSFGGKLQAQQIQLS